MVALKGDSKTIKLLFDNIKKLQATRRDYQLGRLPLGLAMKGKAPSEAIEILLLALQDVEKHFQELNNMYINHAIIVLIGASITANIAFIGWMQLVLGYVDEYVAIDGHKSIEVFVIFNCLAFFLTIGIQC